MKRALSAYNVLNAKFKGLDFEGEWQRAFGNPELSGSWMVWGQSGSGKTTFNMQLAKYMSGFERVIYNSLEEGLSLSIQNAYRRAGICKTDPVQLVSEPMKDLQARLKRRKSPNIVIIDSVKYTRFRWSEYEKFRTLFPRKILIWVAHAKSKEPRGALATDIRYDAGVKIYTEGYRAFVTSRYSLSGTETMDIWAEGAEQYYSEF